MAVSVEGKHNKEGITVHVWKWLGRGRMKNQEMVRGVQEKSLEAGCEG